MQFVKEVRLDLPLDEAWDLISDAPRVAACLPGASVTASDGAVFEGQVDLKVGPIKASYTGTGQIVESDSQQRVMVVDAKGREPTGRGSVAARIRAEAKPSGRDATILTVTTDVDVTGRVAQFGRNVLADVADRLMGEFADNVQATLAPSGPLSGEVSAGSPPSVGPRSGRTANNDLRASTLLVPLAKRMVPQIIAFSVGVSVGVAVSRTRNRRSLYEV